MASSDQLGEEGMNRSAMIHWVGAINWIVPIVFWWDSQGVVNGGGEILRGLRIRDWVGPD